MKSPYFKEEHETFRESVRQFIEKEVVPHADKWEKEEKIPKEIWRKMGELGFLGINYPEEYGGSGADFFYTVAFLEEIARCTIGGFAAAVGVHEYMATAHLSRVGSKELKEKYLIPAIKGEKIGALGITEPNTGSDVSAIRTKAVRDGDFYIINGSKTFITNGVYGDFVTTAVKADPDAGVSGISLIIVDTNSSGFSAKKIKKIGWGCSDTAEISFDNVKVPVTNRIGEENNGFYYIMESFQLERLVGAILAVAGSEHCIEITMKYITQREAFGRPISKFQTIRHTLADLQTELEAARQLTYHTAWLYEQGEIAVKECSMAKLLTTELAKKIVDKCLQFFGGYGYTEEYVISRMYRDARVGTIVGGTSEIMREIISKIMIDQTKYESVYEAEGQEVKEGESPKDERTIYMETKSDLKKCPEVASEIVQTLPGRFVPEKAGSWETVFHFDISGLEGGQFTVIIKNGICKVETGLIGEPKCVVKTEDKTYSEIELGKTNPQTAFLIGKIKISNLAEMMQFTKMFRRLTDI